MKENINFEVNAKGEKTVFHILEGKLPDPENREPITISGNINAPSEFWKKRNNALAQLNDSKSENGTNYDWTVSHVIFDYSNKYIKLIVDEGSQREGETVFSPFGGIGSEGFQALKMKRKSISIELKSSYFKLNLQNHKAAVEENESVLTLF